MKQQSKQKLLAQSLSYELKHNLFQFIIRMSCFTNNIFMNTKDLISAHNKYILPTISHTIFKSNPTISKKDLLDIVQKHSEKKVNINCLFGDKEDSKVEEQEIQCDQFIKQIFKLDATKLELNEGNKQRYCDRANYGLAEIKICLLIIDLIKLKSEFNKGKQILMKMATQNANILWYLIDVQRKGYISFQQQKSTQFRVNYEMKQFGLGINFQDWCSLVRYFDKDSFEVLEKSDFVIRFANDKIIEIKKEKRQLSLVESKIKSKLIPKTELNWFANAYLATKLKKSFMKFPKKNLSVGKAGYTPSTHHIKLMW